MRKPLYPKILDKILQTSVTKSRGFCTSRQLRASMYTRRTKATAKQASGFLAVPQYWAFYKHSGRGPLTSTQRGASVYIWFRNPRNDPRLKNGLSPVRRSEVRNLTSGQYRRWLAENRKARASGLPEPMIIRKRTGPMAKTKQNPFFSDKPGGGLAGIEKSLATISRTEAHKHVEAWLRSTGLKKKVIRRTI